MANFIVLRLIPPAAMVPADFTINLTNLTINVYDVSYRVCRDRTARRRRPP